MVEGDNMTTARSLLKVIKEISVKNKKGLAGVSILATIAAIAVLADRIAPYDPYAIVAPPFQPPSPKHPLGTNDLGQDILSEVIYGSRISLYVGLSAASISTLIGLILGLVSGYFGGRIDEAISGAIDIMLAIPSLPLIIVLAAYLGSSLNNIVLVLVIFGWVDVARVIRAQTLSLRERPYIEAAKAFGSKASRIIFKHILPNVAPIAIAYIILGATSAILIEAGLSFLGLGDPTAKSWGQILHHAQARNALYLGLWTWVFIPGFLIALVGTGFTLLGMAIEEYINPRLESSHMQAN